MCVRSMHYVKTFTHSMQMTWMPAHAALQDWPTLMYLQTSALQTVPSNDV